MMALEEVAQGMDSGCSSGYRLGVAAVSSHHWSRPPHLGASYYM